MQQVVDDKPEALSFWKIFGYISYEVSNHLGNIVATISDRKIAHQDVVNADEVEYYSANITTAQDYYPFGMTMPGRSLNTSDYRYGFQNQETDQELWDGAVSYKYRIEDPRLGRFFSVDPLAPKYPHNSTYAFSENRLIDGVELEGLEVFIKTSYFNSSGQLYRTVIQVVKTSNEAYLNTTGGLTQTVHQCAVSVDRFGNAAAIYTGTIIGTLTASGSSAFNTLENSMLYGVTQIMLQGIVPTKYNGIQTGLIERINNPDVWLGITSNIYVTTIGATRVPISDQDALLKNQNLTIVDPDNDGMVVIEPNSALVPTLEPWLPAGFNNIPQSGLFDATTLNPIQNINYFNFDAPLDIQFYNSDKNSFTKSAFSLNGARIITGLPAARIVGSGDPRNFVGLLSITIN